MDLELQAKTAAGEQLVALAERLAEDFATRADQHDREGSYPFENIEALKESGYAMAAIPADCGGLGVDLLHDIVVASSRLARGDPAITIGINMHFVVTGLLARHWRMACAAGREKRADGLATTLAAIVADKTLFAALVSEAGQDLTHPTTTAVRDGDGWRVNGTKIFATMSPAASILNVAVAYRDEEGGEYYGYAAVPRDAQGVTVHDDWDALGMRASGSCSVSLEEVRIPADALRDRFPVGEVSDPFLERNLSSGPLHASAPVGIAETAHRTAIEALRRRPRGSAKRRAVDRPTVQLQAAENEVELSAIRATLARGADLVDGYYAGHPATPGPRDEIRAVFKESQATKAFIQSAAIRTVDRALAMSGGAGYLSKSPLSRHYRDVRATPFMHPLGANAAYELIAQLALGLELSLA